MGLMSSGGGVSKDGRIGLLYQGDNGSRKPSPITRSKPKQDVILITASVETPKTHVQGETKLY